MSIVPRGAGCSSKITELRLECVESQLEAARQRVVLLEQRLELRTPRQPCTCCGRPPSVCVCAAVPAKRVRLRRTRVLIVQHWREEKKKKIMGTMPIAKLCIDSDSLEVCVDRSIRGDRGAMLGASDTAASLPALGRALGLLPASTAGSLPHRTPLLLFPGQGAVALHELLASEASVPGEDASCSHSTDGDGDGERTASHRRTLIVLDGTWKQASQLMRRHRAALAHAARVMLVGCGRSRYEEIRRREPAEGVVSTLEALAAALRLLEHASIKDVGADNSCAPPVVSDVLLDCFELMVSKQKCFVPRRVSAPPVAKLSAAEVKERLRLRDSKSEQKDAHGAHLGRRQAYVICKTHHCALTAKRELVPVGVDLAKVEALQWQSSADAAVACGMLWCSATEAARACLVRNESERRPRGSRFVALPADCSHLCWRPPG